MSGPERVTFYRETKDGEIKPHTVHVGAPTSVVCRINGKARRVRIGATFEVLSLGGPMRVEVVAIEPVEHTSEMDGFRWTSWRAVLKRIEVGS